MWLLFSLGSSVYPRLRTVRLASLEVENVCAGGLREADSEAKPCARGWFRKEGSVPALVKRMHTWYRIPAPGAWGPCGFLEAVTALRSVLAPPPLTERKPEKEKMGARWEIIFLKLFSLQMFTFYC